MDEKESLYIEMMNENKSLIYKISSIYTHTPEDRKDLMQDIAYQLWRSFDTFEHRSRLSTWLYKVSMNTALHFLKKKNRSISKRALVMDELPYVNATSDTKTDALQKMMSTIQSLAPMDKGIILLYLEERSHQEIADIIGLSVTNVGTKIQRIKQKLKKLNS